MPNRSESTTAAAEHRSVSRTMAILELVALREPDGVRLGDLADAIGAPKSSAHGLAKGLVAVGYLREHDGRYLIGPAVLNLLGGKLPTFPAAYHSALEQLVDRWQETAFLATLVGDSSVYVDSVDSPHFIRAAPPLNTRVPLWPRSAGKCFLAWMAPRQVDSILRRDTYDAATIEGIKEQLLEIRHSRVATNLSESAPDMIGVASPILSSRGGSVTVAIAIGGPESRMKPRIEEIIASVRETADALAAWA
jgi:DNA-binding IclR family transcriptional regulator